MIGRIVQVARMRRTLIGVVSIALLVFGFIQLDGTRVENLPEFNPPFVEVQTEALGLSASEVEQLITVPLEADLLNGVAFVQNIESQSMPGLSSILMTFEPGTNVLDARQLVQERLTQAAGLPNVSRAPAMVQPLSSESRIMMVGLTSDELSLVDLGVLARWTIRPRLQGIDGVANVVVWGRREQQLQVRVDPAVLEANDLALIDLVETTGNALWVSPLSFLEASTPGVGGFIDGPNQRIGIRHVPAISTPEDLAAVAVDGRPDLVLGDVADIVVDHQPLIGDAVIDGESGIYLIIEKFPWSNTAETTRAVEDALVELEPGLTGVTLDSDLFRPARYLERAVDSIQLATVIALLLVAAVLMALIGDIKVAVTVVLSLLTAMTASGLVLYLTGASVNTMILLGLAAGSLLIIDDSVRNVFEMQRQGASRLGMIAGVRANSSSLAYASLLLAVVLIPVLFMDGPAGEFTPSIGYGLLLALLVGFVVSILVTPAFASLWTGGLGDASAKQTKPAEFLRRTYDSRLANITRHPTRVAGVAIVLALVGVALIPFTNSGFVPQFHQTDLSVSFDAASGVSLPETRRVAGRMAQEVAEVPGVLQANAQVGRAILSDEIANVNTGGVWLSIDPDADYDTTFDRVQEIVDSYPGIGRPTINTYSNDQVDKGLRRPTKDLVVRVYGDVPEQLTSLAVQLQGTVDGVDGVENARALLPVLEPTVEIEVDLERSAAELVKPGDVRRAAATLLSGIEVGSLFEDQRVFEVVVWSQPEIRNSVSAIENLIIDTPAGSKVRLGDVATVRVAPNERVIQRDAVSRFIDIVADVPGRDVSDVQDDITALVEESGLPYEFHIGFVDDGTTNSQQQFLLVVGAVVVTMLLLLQAAFTSFRLALVAAVGTLIALTGSIVAIVIAGGEYSVGSFAGLLAIAGLTMRSSISLLQRYEALQLDEEAELGPDAMAEGATRHFWPTVVSLSAVAAASLPFVVFGTRAGTEVLHPFAVAVLGGTVTSLAVSLFLVPGVYLLVARPAVPPELLMEQRDDARADTIAKEQLDSLRSGQ